MVSKVTFKVPVELGDTKNKREILDRIGDFLVESILKDVGGQKSPVDGSGFQSLSKGYQATKERKGRGGVPNLELMGDMLDALKYEKGSDYLEVGIFNSKQALKADNHNKFSPESLETAVPKRQFIPNADNGDGFREGIVRGVRDILKDYDVDKKKIEKIVDKFRG